MEVSDFKHQTLPLFRSDLEIFQGPDEADGSPSYNIHDPVKGQYYKISWAEALIIKSLHQGMTVDDLCKEVNRQSTLNVTPKEIKQYFEDAAKLNLLSITRPSKHVEKEAQVQGGSFLQWLLFHYLYIRVPLVDPDDFLKKTLKYVKPLASKQAFILYSILSCIGMVCLFLRMEEFAYTFTYFFNLKGFVIYALALTGVKIIHELSHAYTAVNYGVRVPSMGVAFLVLWPILYTDVTDGWKLQNRKHRLNISLAGIIVETVVAGLCTLGWAFSSSGVMKSLFFVVAAVSWISTFVINANPMMRFDGYYILSDFWGMDNLQSRAFAVTRWKLRDWILGLKLQCPEPKLSEKRILGLVVYSICTWIYRLALYMTIALFVYYSFTKVLGVFLFLLEIGVFIVWPLFSEMKTLYLLRSRLEINKRVIFFGCLILVGFFWVALPVSRSESFTGITQPYQEQVVYVPADAIIENIHVVRGQPVSQGDPLITLKSKEMDASFHQSIADARTVQQEIKLLSLEDSDFAQIPEKTREFEGLLAKIKGLETKRKELALQSDMDGQLISWDDTLREGLPLSKDRVLGKIADLGQVSVVSFVPESLLHTVYEGQEAQFIMKGGEKKFYGKVISINPVRARRLFYPALASVYKGDLPVIEDANGNLMLVESYYPITVYLEADGSDVNYDKVGVLRVWGPKRSLLFSSIKQLISLFWKESGF